MRLNNQRVADVAKRSPAKNKTSQSKAGVAHPSLPLVRVGDFGKLELGVRENAQRVADVLVLLVLGHDERVAIRTRVGDLDPGQVMRTVYSHAVDERGRIVCEATIEAKGQEKRDPFRV